MTITAEQLYWAAVNAPNITDGMNRAQAILDEDRLATTAAVLATAGAVPHFLYDCDGTKGERRVAEDIAATIRALDPDETAWLAARDVAMRKAGADEALAVGVKGWVSRIDSEKAFAITNERQAEIIEAGGGNAIPCTIIVSKEGV